MTARRPVPSALALMAALLTLFATAGVVLAARMWTVDASPLSLHQGSQAVVTLTVQNVGGSGGGDEITCVTFDIPTSSTVGSASIVSISGATSGHGWTTVTGSVAGGTRVAFKNPSDNNPLVGLPVGDQAVFRITVTPGTAGAETWTAGAADKPGSATGTKCGSGTFPSATLPFAVTPSIPAPTATPRPSPAPTPAPTPAATATPAPTATPRPTPRPTSAPTASPTGTAMPAPSHTPSPTALPTAAPQVTPSPRPTAAPTPAASQALPTVSPGPSTSAPATSPTATPASTASPVASQGLGAVAPPPGGAPPPAAGALASDTRAGRVPINGSSLAVAIRRSDGETLSSDAIARVALDALTQLGIGAWAVPGVVVGVPGLLVVLAVVLQAGGAGAWLPVARHWLSGTGVESKDRRGGQSPPDRA